MLLTRPALICEDFAFQVPAPDFALAVVKGLSHVAPHAHALKLKNEDFSRDPKAAQVMNDDPLIKNETQCHRGDKSPGRRWPGKFLPE